MEITDKNEYLEYYGGAAKSCPTEKIEHINCVSWLKHNYPDYLFFHPVNEGLKHKASAVMDTQMGLIKGVSDFVILIGFGGKYPFAAIELKRQGKAQASPVSKEQREFLAAVRRRGGFAAVAYGFEQFKIAFCDAIK